MLVRGDDGQPSRTCARCRRRHRSHPHGGPAFGYEFLQRADGYPGLARTYGLHFTRPPTAMDLSLIYRALAEGQVDLIAGDATSGLIDAYGFAMLEDDRHYFPPYDAGRRRALSDAAGASRGERGARQPGRPDHHRRHAAHEPGGRRRSSRSGRGRARISKRGALESAADCRASRSRRAASREPRTASREPPVRLHSPRPVEDDQGWPLRIRSIHAPGCQAADPPSISSACPRSSGPATVGSRGCRIR